MVSSFGFRLDHQLGQLTRPPGTIQHLEAEKTRLAGLKLPPGLDPATGAAVRGSIGNAFSFGFRLIMLICAALAVASAVVSRLLIPNQNFSPASNQSFMEEQRRAS